jgi:hypothetical protein
MPVTVTAISDPVTEPRGAPRNAAPAPLALCTKVAAAGAAWLVDARWKALALSGGATSAIGAGKELLTLRF